MCHNTYHGIPSLPALTVDNKKLDNVSKEIKTKIVNKKLDKAHYTENEHDTRLRNDSGMS